MTTEKRTYYLLCPTEGCFGESFQFKQGITKEETETWHTIEIHKALSHDGWGWELENFDITCIKCNKQVDPKVEWRLNETS